ADPVCGRTVVAILDLGRHLPFIIHYGGAGDDADHTIVNKPVYSVTEFSS
ncbi:MAG: hypothetical protein QOI98_1071, partial [Solirubrobacteraceae bacterium]|nr:hypothetical protein [Solirubrobacteraceae bacterium]